MKTEVWWESLGRNKGRVFLCILALVIGTSAGSLAVAPVVLLALGVLMVLIVFALKSLREPLVFVLPFLLALILLPPFFWSPLGETPIFASMFLVPVGLAVALLRLPDLRLRPDPVAKGLAVFLLGTGLSLPFGWWLSGMQIGNQSFLHWLTLAQTALIYFLARSGGWRCETRLEQWLIPILVGAGTLSAAYGIFDFVWPVPLPHPAAGQFIWLHVSILRRAQGVFYEAGNFANMGAFFLVVAAASLLSGHERTLRIPLPWLVMVTVILGVAVFVSFTRSAWASVLVALLAFPVVSRRVRWGRAFLLLGALSVPVIALWFISPELWDYLLSSRLGNLDQLFIDPNLASSGRFDTWTLALSLLAGHPQYLLFGVGYKTLPFTRLFHGALIMDNGFLNLVLETGIVGLGGFLFLSARIFATFLRAAGQRTGESAFWGAALFSFWCGEWVQMMAVDAYTYWRNMVVFLAVMGIVMDRLERPKSHPPSEL